jgi:cation diffusion facilitator family transporter
MKSCCEDKAEELASLRGTQRRVLWIVLIINACMFVVEMISGILSHSTALLGDSLDMLGDALVYGVSLFAIDRGMRWKYRAALLKGTIMLTFGLGVLIEAILKVFYSLIPSGQTMGIIGFLALLANLMCLFLLHPHRHDDINMRSTWICSRNDISANGGVLLAAASVVFLQSQWPDILVGSTIAVIFLASALGVLKDSIRSHGHSMSV